MRQKQVEIANRIRRSEFLIALIVSAALIFIGVGLARENNKIVPVTPSITARYTLEPGSHLSFLSNWDGPIYLDIAQHGYTSVNQANFFPLYPLLVHIVHIVIPSLLYSGLIVAWVSFVGAAYYFLKIIKKLYGLTDNLKALQGTLFFVLFPTGVFLMATYTESLFAFLSLAAIYYALQNKYWVSAGFAALLTATHFNGLFVLALVGLIMLEKRENIFNIFKTMLIGSIGFISYLIYQDYLFNNPLAFLHAQKLHSWVNLNDTHLIDELFTLNGIFLFLVIISTIYWWKKRKIFSIYLTFYILIVFISGRDFSGFGRYALMAFPLEIMLYDYFRNKKVGYPIALAICSIFWTFMLLRYVGGYTGG